ncbi:MAG: hypothetical protein WBC86_21420, partial [Pseudolabrys sp.]
MQKGQVHFTPESTPKCKNATSQTFVFVAKKPFESLCCAWGSALRKYRLRCVRERQIGHVRSRAFADEKDVTDLEDVHEVGPWANVAAPTAAHQPCWLLR